MLTQYNKYTQDDNNTHKTTTTIHTVNQQQLHKRQPKTSNKTVTSIFKHYCDIILALLCEFKIHTRVFWDIVPCISY